MLAAAATAIHYVLTDLTSHRPHDLRLDSPG